MRITIIFFVALVGIMLTAVPSSFAQNCRCECYRVQGGRVCRKVCSYPRYVPREPSYSPPQYTQSFATHSPPSLTAISPVPPELLGFLVVAAIVVVIAVIIASASSSHSSAIAEIDRDTDTTNQVAADLEAAMRKADAHIASALAKVRDGGRYVR